MLGSHILFAHPSLTRIVIKPCIKFQTHIGNHALGVKTHDFCRSFLVPSSNFAVRTAIEATFPSTKAANRNETSQRSPLACQTHILAYRLLVKHGAGDSRLGCCCAIAKHGCSPLLRQRALAKAKLHRPVPHKQRWVHLGFRCPCNGNNACPSQSSGL